MNLINHINKVIVKITKGKYLGQYAGDGVRPTTTICVEIHQSAAQFGYILRDIGNRVRGC